MFCKYKDLFGKPGQGIHSYRIFNIAILDVIITILGAVVIKALMPKYNFIVILFLVFLSGIIVHRLFCVRTTVDKLLFGSN
jgi:hypothetical protein